MHPDQLYVDDTIVRHLVDDQFPQWRDESVRRLAIAGTVNAIFKIGRDLTARFPLNPADPVDAADALRAEAAAMRELRVICPVPTPEPVTLGEPGAGYSLPWSIQSWVPGTVATPDGLAHSRRFAEDLVLLITSLRGADTRGRRFDGVGRGGDLRDSDDWMQRCFHESTDLLPVDALEALWEMLRSLPGPAPDVMTHGDLIPGNLLVNGERLAGVLDGGGFSPADPALDLASAWHLLDADARDVVRGGVHADPIEWRRGAAWAFQQAMGLVWYYRESNPGMSARGRSTLSRLLADPEINSVRFMENHA